MKFHRIDSFDKIAFINTRIVDISVTEGIKASIGKLVLDNMSDAKPKVQSYLFDSEKWNKDKANEWIEKYKDYTLESLITLNKEIDITGNKETKKVVKFYRAKVVRIDSENHIAYAQINTGEIDRYKEVLPIDSWKKRRKSYNEHPVLLSSHNYFSLRAQIGEAVDVDWDTMTFGFHWYAGEGNPEADWGWTLAEKGIAGFSVGYIPHKRLRGEDIPDEYKEDEKNRDKEPNEVQPDNELLEVSQVVIGADRGALQSGFDNDNVEQLKYALEVSNKFGKDIPDFINEVRMIDAGMKPYPNEHSCRLKDPDDYDKCKRTKRKSDGKEYSILTCQKKDDKEVWEEQAFRYDKETWTVAEAKKHCKDHDGILFEPASEKDINKINDDSIIISPVEIKNMKELEEIVAIYKSGRVLSEKNRKIIKSAVLQLTTSVKVLNELLELTEPKDEGGGKIQDLSHEVKEYIKRNKKS